MGSNSWSLLDSLLEPGTIVINLHVFMIITKTNLYLHVILVWLTRVRVANELGAGNGKGARFATIVSVTTSAVIGLFFWVLIMLFHNELALIFTNSEPVLDAVSRLALLLAFTILLNSVQPVLSGKRTPSCFITFCLLYKHFRSLIWKWFKLLGVAVGSGWQSYVAYINLGCYYLIGVPMGLAMGWLFHLGVMVIILFK